MRGRVMLAAFFAVGALAGCSGQTPAVRDGGPATADQVGGDGAVQPDAAPLADAPAPPEGDADPADGAPGDADDESDSDVATDTGPDAAHAPDTADIGSDDIYGVTVPRASAWWVDATTLYRGADPVVLRGFSWFGLETPDLAPHGLWTGRSILSFLEQMQGLGFNAVRLPIAPQTLIEGEPTAPWAQAQGLATAPDALRAVLQATGALDMAVLFDVHTCHVLRGGGEAESPVACAGYDLAAWHADLTTLARLADEFRHVVGIDLFNEPHELGWAEWAALTSEAAEVVLRENPRILIFVEGVGNESNNGGFHAFWGENLTEALALPVQAPPSRLVYSPHVYGPSVEAMDYFDSPDFPANMPAIWDTHFGALHAAGWAVVPGELGGIYDEGKMKGSVVWQDALVAYLVDRGMRSFFYWSLNPTSSDTGGLLLDDWQTPNEAKLDSLAPLLAPPP